MRRPGPEEAWERRRGALALKRLPSRLFEGGGRTEGKSIGKEQEACDGMANRVSALMFQTLGELVAWLAVLRASAQPCTISSKHIHTKGVLCSSWVHTHPLTQAKEKDASVRSSALLLLFPRTFWTVSHFGRATKPQRTQSQNTPQIGGATTVWFYMMMYAGFNSKSRTRGDSTRGRKREGSSTRNCPEICKP